MRRPLSSILTFMLILAFGSQLFATSLFETQVRDDSRRPIWRGSITIAVSSSFSDLAPNIKQGSDVLGALERGVRAWKSASGIDIRLVPSSRQDVSAIGTSGDGVSLLTLAPTAANTLFFSRAEQSPAKTRLFFSRRNYITEADIALNPAVQFSTDGTFGTFDLEAVLMHEIGHLLGLRHSFVPGSIMYESIVRNGALSRSQLNNSISASDVADLRGLYPSTDLESTCCGEITGRVSGNAKRDVTFEIWARNDLTGEVSAATTATRGRTFRLTGLEQGNYTIFSQAFAGDRAFEAIEVGSFEISPGLRSTIQIESNLGRPVDQILAIGLNGVLADRSIPVLAGTESQLIVAVDPRSKGMVGFDIRSSFVYIDPMSIVEIDHADGVRTFAMKLVTNEAAAKGNHTICSISAGGGRTCIAGGINIR